MSISQKSARAKYAQQKSGAKARGIGFNLTFEQWSAIWGDKLEQRGPHSWQFVMCRIGDAGPYAVGNVYIGSPARNGASRRMALENRRGSASVYAHANMHWRGDRDSDTDATDPEYIERELGLKTSGIWA